ncbi:TlpA disulfide reductase family protein [Tamlana sp. 2_MG-2023]|uniref:TlpA family protein disulfide reductase n=1 Tax=unclassified Tamlana TaxID=2614803 RepID=UPI0026E44B6B|nr:MULTISPECIES: TlpA disulfide reductase family protein [unclassified Tamlana]MDO6758729.1 TlpA disulfide reductase family protein [Tamlana sp. 2_MG-2023]MDO6789428.1 TlpA disulfide reductase family protein [Tamlana sp. 1_MG-2023]
MKKIVYLLVILLSFTSCNAQTPTKFTQAALNDTFLSLEGKSVALKDILKAHQGKDVVIDIWASWCSDCIKGMPKVKALQEKHPDVAYVFLSLDRKLDAWKNGIKKYKVEGEHYYLENGKKSAFGDFVNIDWIPRYMVVDAEGNIKLFKAVEADDKNIEHILNN